MSIRDDLIFYLVSRDEWKQNQEAGLYSPASLEEEGFIHCATGQQIQEVANSRFAGREGLLLLVIDVASLESDVKMEPGGSGEEISPHIYGPLNIDAVIDKIKLEPEENGSFYIEFNSSE